jgi:hydrogenase-4 component F
MRSDLLLRLCLALPVACALLASRLPRPRAVVRLGSIGAGLCVGLDLLVVAAFWRHGGWSEAGGWLRVDALAAFHLGLLALVYGLATLFAVVYLGEELRRGQLSLRQARVFSGLWCGSLASMTLLLLSNNLGIMWVGMETTTLLTAFLISVHVSRESLEAMWKYVLICSVAVAFAFMGTLLAAAASPPALARSALFWTNLLAAAPQLDPMLMRAAFVFLLVGYGTKAGLAPMHNWLPDAHSQAPAPVSALFSGFMLNAALYCLLRFLPVVDRVPGCAGWAQSLLTAFGLLSLGVGAGFILFQHDAKRLLAYCSVEHVGLIAVGAGLGGLGTFAALFHSLNHALAKTLAFFAVGRLGQGCGSHSIARLSGAFRLSALWGVGLLAGLLGLMGAAPAASFVSELQLVRSAFLQREPMVFVALLLGLAVAFVGMLRHTLRLAWARSDAPTPVMATVPLELALVAGPLLLLLALALWLPAPLAGLIEQAAGVIDGGPAALAAAVHLP